MKLPLLVRGTLVQRDNRFRATVRVNESDVSAHVPNSGRLGELLVPGYPVWLQPVGCAARKTAYDLQLVEAAGTWVCIDTRRVNDLFAEALADGYLGVEPLRVQREVIRGNSRLDFRLIGATGVCWVEVKSVTLVRGGVALFPDAPTKRGCKHLYALADAVTRGDRALILFMVQRDDAVSFAPHEARDPAFAEALRDAARIGVAVRALACAVQPEAIRVVREIPVRLESRK